VSAAPLPLPLRSGEPTDAAGMRRVRFDTVVMNPPFGTRNAGVDVAFVRTALRLSNRVYSLHKTSTRDFLLRKAGELGAQAEVVAELKFDVPKSYAFHKEKSKDVFVDLVRFSRSDRDGGDDGRAAEDEDEDEDEGGDGDGER